jgi:hypothetical protein
MRMLVPLGSHLVPEYRLALPGPVKTCWPPTKGMIHIMGYIKSAALEETGYVVLDRYNQELDPQEWLDIEFVDWKSSGETQFAPLASAKG